MLLKGYQNIQSFFQFDLCCGIYVLIITSIKILVGLEQCKLRFLLLLYSIAIIPLLISALF